VLYLFTPRIWIWSAASFMVAEQNFAGTLTTFGCPQPSTLNAMLCSLPESTPELASSANTMFRQVVINDYTNKTISTHTETISYIQPQIHSSILFWHCLSQTGLTAHRLFFFQLILHIFIILWLCVDGVVDDSLQPEARTDRKEQVKKQK